MPTKRLYVRKKTQFENLNYCLVILMLFYSIYSTRVFAQNEASVEKNQKSIITSDSLNDYHQNSDLLVGSESQLQGNVIEKTPFSNIKNSLAGYLKGLYVAESGGEPGAEFSTLLIRGKRTISSGNNSPYILVDGYERDINYLDPNDIKSITILKDAVATSIYGLKGASGVILVITKRGNTSGRTRVTFDSQAALKQAMNKPKAVGSADYMKYFNMARVNDGSSASYDPTLIDKYSSSTDKYLYPNVNWLGKFFNPVSYKQRYSLGIDGGDKIIKYYFSISYLNDIGNIVTDPSVNRYSTQNKQDQYSIRSNIDIQVTKRLSLSTNLSAMYSFVNLPNNQSGSTLYTSLLNYIPNAHPILNEDGSVAGNQQYSNNPYAVINKGGYGENFTSYVTANINLNYDLDFITKGFRAYGSLAFDNNNVYNSTRTENYATYEWTKDLLGNPMYALDGSKIYKQWGNNSSLNLIGTSNTYYRRLDFEAGLNYNRNIGKHSLSALLVGYNYDYENDILLPHAMAGVNGHLGYAYNSKYLIDFSGSWSGTEQFPANNRMHFFPAAGIGWVISNENFLKNNDLISFLKIRASYGLTGDDNLKNGKSNIYYDYLGSFKKASGNVFLGEGNPLSITGSGLFTTGYVEGGVSNPLLVPEMTTKTNFGIDLRLLNNKLSFSADYFKEYTHDILAARQSIPYMMGIPSGNLMLENIGEVLNEGCEFEIGYQQKVGKFNLFVSANATYAHNKIIYLDEETGLPEPKTGYPIDAYWGFRTLGFFQTNAEIAASPSQQAVGTTTPGDLKFKDMNGDNVINEYDRIYLGAVGMPDWTFGINLGAKYNGWELSCLFQGVTGLNEVYRDGINTPFSNNGNMYDFQVGKFWTPENSINPTYPRLTIVGSSSTKANADFWIKDASYIRLKNVELSYNFSAKWISNYAGFRIYLSGTNLITLDKLNGMIDPETSSDGQAYPINRMYSIGLRLSL